MASPFSRVVIHCVAKALIALIRIYQLMISPLMAPHCIYQVTCSEYAKQQIIEFGIFKGGCLAVKRLLSCHPLSGSRTLY